MDALCCICVDRFVKDPNVNIAAVPCGHVFHESCLAQWLLKSSTCPSCRTTVARSQVIPKLYFMFSSETPPADRSSQSASKFWDLEVELKQMAMEKEEWKRIRQEMMEEIEQEKLDKVRLSVALQNAQTMNQTMRLELKNSKTQLLMFDNEKKEYSRVKQQLEILQKVERLVKGCQGEIDAIVNKDGNGQSKAELATYCVVLKREYDLCKREKKNLREELEVEKKEFGCLYEDFFEKSTELEVLKKQYACSESELKECEKEILILRKLFQERELSSLKKESTKDFTMKSYFTEKKENLFLEFPKGIPTEEKANPSSSDAGRSHLAEKKCNACNFPIRITSAAGQSHLSKKPKLEDGLTKMLTSHFNFNAVNKQKCSNIQWGYNGLGGHSSHAQNIACRRKGSCFFFN